MSGIKRCWRILKRFGSFLFGRYCCFGSSLHSILNLKTLRPKAALFLQEGGVGFGVSVVSVSLVAVFA